jgi:hypothetical protein
MTFRSTLNKLNFALGRNPEIEKKLDWRRFIPNPYKAVLLISADFELAWAWQYAKNAHGKLDMALEKARLERANIPELVKLCDEYSLPMTWATVGHLFLESCAKNGLPHSDLPRLPFFQNEFWRFAKGDWFQNDPCSNYKDAPEWYCPDLIKMILAAKEKHEIGCHTFSHIDCRDGTCPPEVMRAELQECKKIALERGIGLKSFVHPGYTIGNLDALADEGFSNYRTDYRNVLGYPKKHANGLWEFEQTAEIAYREDWSIDYHISRFIAIIKRAIKTNSVCVLWFHPSFDPVVVEKILPEVFRFIDENKDQILATTNSQYVDWLEKEWKR